MAEIKYTAFELRKWKIYRGFIIIKKSAHRLSDLISIDVNGRNLNIYFGNDQFEQIPYGWESQSNQAQTLLIDDIFACTK